jgi:hypothetical protein
MHSLREQPRVTARNAPSRPLTGRDRMAVGALLDGEGGDREKLTDARVASARRSVTPIGVELDVARGRQAGRDAAQPREAGPRVLAHAKWRLRRELSPAQPARQATRQR